MDQNLAMQAMMMHMTMHQQQNSMRQLNHMLEQDNQRMLYQQQIARQRREQAMEEELYDIYYGDKR